MPINNWADYNYEKEVRPLKDATVTTAATGGLAATFGVIAASLLDRSGAGLFDNRRLNIKNRFLERGVMTYQQMLVRTGIGQMLFKRGGIQAAYGAALGIGAAAGLVEARNQVENLEG